MSKYIIKKLKYAPSLSLNHQNKSDKKFVHAPIND